MGQGTSTPPPIPITKPPPPKLPSLPHNWNECSRSHLRDSWQQMKLWTKYKRRNTSERIQVRLNTIKRVYQKRQLIKDLSQLGQEWSKRLEPLKHQPFPSAIAIGGGCAVGMAGFALTRLGSSFILQSMRISSSNRIAATLGGAIGLIACTNVAAHSTLYSTALIANQFGFAAFPFQPITPASPSFITFSTILILSSYVQYRFLGGRLIRFAPSDVMRRGSFAHESIKAPSNDYADTRTKRLLSVAGGHHGCHSCGRSRSWWGVGPRLQFIGDHIPPNKYAKLADLASGAVTTPGMPRGLWNRLWPFKPRKTPQVFLPQCERCSLIQSQAVRMDRRTLIFPRSWRWYDVWLPIPLWLTIICLPFMESLQIYLDAEESESERELDLHPDRPNRTIRQRLSQWWKEVNKKNKSN